MNIMDSKLIKAIIENNNHPISENDPNFITNENIDYCFIYHNIFGFTLYSKEDLDKIAKFLNDKKVLEVLSGCGFLAKELKIRGVNIIATDDFSWHDDGWIDWTKDNIICLDACEAIEKYKDWADIIIMAWPPYEDNNDIGSKVLKLCIQYNIPLLYQGEWDGGNCASEEFFNLIYKKCNFKPNILPTHRFKYYHNKWYLIESKEGE